MEHKTDPLEQAHAFGRVIDVLEAIGAVYAVWGGLAVVAYGEPRFTLDMDILLSPVGFLSDRFVQRLGELNYHTDKRSIQRALLSGGFFAVIDLNTQIKVDFYVPQDDPLLQQALRERVYLPFDDIRRAAYVTAVAAVVTKLRAYADSESTRHLEDIASIVRVQGKKLDGAAIDIIAARLKVFGQWRYIWETNRQG